MPETTLLAALHKLAEIFGPVGAVAIAMSLVLGYFYRKDFLRERKRTQAMHERAEAREDRALGLVKESADATREHAVTTERLSQVIAKLGDSIERAEENRQRHLDTMTQFLAHRKG